MLDVEFCKSFENENKYQVDENRSDCLVGRSGLYMNKYNPARNFNRPRLCFFISQPN